jgi:hypothetical protein
LSSTSRAASTAASRDACMCCVHQTSHTVWSHNLVSRSSHTVQLTIQTTNSLRGNQAACTRHRCSAHQTKTNQHLCLWQPVCN